MKITFLSYCNIQVASADGLKTYEHQAGETVTVPTDLATYFLNAGIAQPAQTEKASKVKGETATK